MFWRVANPLATYPDSFSQRKPGTLFEHIVAENKMSRFMFVLVYSSVLSAGSETDIKTVGAKDEDVKSRRRNQLGLNYGQARSIIT